MLKKQAYLIAKWMSLGFIHGVMNTDNMLICGETIDYGPCAFMDQYRANTVFSSIDRQGRYAYQNQPAIAQWNLARFAECILPFLHQDTESAIQLATEKLKSFQDIYEENWLILFSQKIGLERADKKLIDDLLEMLEKNKIDFTIFFRRLAYALDDVSAEEGPAALFSHKEDWRSWGASWQLAIKQEPSAIKNIQEKMLATNPAFIPRNHQVENMITEAVDNHDFSLFQQFIHDCQNPFVENEKWSQAPDKINESYKTFCGT